MDRQARSIIILSILLVVQAGLIFLTYFRQIKPVETENAQTTAVSEQKQNLNLFFVGDIMIDRHVGEKIDKNGSLDFIFSGLENDFFENHDLVSANLEGAVTNGGSHYDPEQAYDFAFAPARVKELKKFKFNYFNIANNHLTDQGERGIIETKENLEKLNINFSGCKDATVGDCSVKILEIKDKKISLIGLSMVYGIFDLKKTSDIISQTKNKSDLVIMNIHWGVEYEHRFNKVQQNMARAIVDAGADLIIGHHPHVVQGMEIYKNKAIFYSLGNFVFDQYFSADTQEGLAIEINLTDSQTNFSLMPVRSQGSQLRPMTDKEREEFLKKFLSWSEVDSYSQEIINNNLSIKQK